MHPTPRPPSAAALLETARRLGPRPYSEGGPSPAPALPSSAELVGWMVEAIDGWWAELGCPDPFTLVEIGAGDGARAQAFLAAGPACLTALRCVLVEADPVLRDRQRARLPIESPILVLGPVGPGDGDDGGDGDVDPDEQTRAVAGIGPLITSLPESPVVDGDALVVAVGWVSRLPSDRLEWRDGRWWEIRLAAGDDSELSELPNPHDRDRAAGADRLLAEPGAGAGSRPVARPDGARYAALTAAVSWLAGALRMAGSGRLAVIDRWTEVTRPLAPGEAPPLALNQLAAVRRPIEPAPVGLFPELWLVSWRLG